MTTTTQSSTVPTTRTLSSTRQIFGLMLAAYLLSVTHTVANDLSGIAADDFALTDPLPYATYAVCFAATALALVERTWARLAVVAFLVLQQLVGIFVYPDTFGPEQQTTFGWFENDVFLGLLAIALYLAVLRVTGVTLRHRG